MSVRSSRYLAPLAHRDFALLWSGQAISQFGDGIFTVTVALEALRLSNDAIGLSLVLAARLAPAVVFALFGGVIVDRVPRRFAMLASDLAQGLAVAVIAVLVLAGHADLVALVAMALVFGLGDAVFYPASVAIIPELLPDELLVSASALSATSLQLGRVLLGPALGGVIAGLLGTGWGFGLDAVSFAVSSATLVAMRASGRPAGSDREAVAGAGTGGGAGALDGIREGLDYLRSQRWLWVTALAAGLGNLVAMEPLGATIPLLVRHVLHGDGVQLGLVLGAGGLGGLLASVALGHRRGPRDRFVHLWLGWGLSGIGVVGLGLAPDLWLAAGLAFVTYGLDAYGSVLYAPLLQAGVPGHLLGRVSSVDYVLGFALGPLGLVAAGAVAELIGVRGTLIAGGAITALTTLVPLLPGVNGPAPGPPGEDDGGA